MKGSWFLRQFTGLLVIIACVSCASLSGNRNKKKEPPEITHEMPLSDAIEAGMEQMADTFKEKGGELYVEAGD